MTKLKFVFSKIRNVADMKAFVTGATGFVGSHVARLLSEQGADLRLLVRPSSRQDNIERLNAELVTGDLADANSLRRGMQDCDVVFHVAADYRLWTRDSQSMYAANVGGTEQVIRSAQAAGIRRIVYTSSVATMGFHHEPEPVDEQSAVSERDMIGHYKRSKFMAEQVAVELAKQGAPVVVVNPSTPIGEQDIKPTPTGRIVVDFLKRKFPAYVETGLNLVDVVDVARGHLLACERGRIGERYILGGENLTLKQILDSLASITGLPSPSIKLPYAAAFVSGVFDTFFTGVLMNREPRVTLDSVRMGRKIMWVSSAKAENELGYRASPVREALRRAAEWFVEHGYAAEYRQACELA
jgi:dihydroflavonol-4-reductase